jgi:CheY-like chemotaxis protein
MKKLRRVLLVDDDEVANFLSKRLLKQLQVSEEVITLTDGSKALDFVQQHYLVGNDILPGLDLIFLDLNMPIMGGFEFLEKLKELPPLKQLAICILTSSSLESDQARAATFNADNYVTKPLTEEKIRTVLRQLP